MELSASLEDYIETIYHIVEEKQVARAKNIADHLGVSRASVTEALRTLSSKGLINYAPYEVITMTSAGRIVAEDVIFRHTTLKKFFTEILTIDEETAEDGACKIEHAAPPQVINRMIDFMKFVNSSPDLEESLINNFKIFIESRKTGNQTTD
ncbi:MAG: metal-dependent transcriptional regulator [Desulfocapsaceae bacterium]|nr:metal-dependent transcriptional regulator [Desulfocapsaceae bacterium]